MDALKIPLKDDAALNLVQKEFGLKGFAIAIKIAQEIVYSGGKYGWTYETIGFMARENGISLGLVYEVSNYGIKVGLFDLLDGCLSFGRSSGRIRKLNKGD